MRLGIECEAKRDRASGRTNERMTRSEPVLGERDAARLFAANFRRINKSAESHESRAVGKPVGVVRVSNILEHLHWRVCLFEFATSIRGERLAANLRTGYAPSRLHCNGVESLQENKHQAAPGKPGNISIGLICKILEHHLAYYSSSKGCRLLYWPFSDY